MIAPENSPNPASATATVQTRIPPTDFPPRSHGNGNDIVSHPKNSIATIQRTITRIFVLLSLVIIVIILLILLLPPLADPVVAVITSLSEIRPTITHPVSALHAFPNPSHPAACFPIPWLVRICGRTPAHPFVAPIDIPATATHAAADLVLMHSRTPATNSRAWVRSGGDDGGDDGGCGCGCGGVDDDDDEGDGDGDDDDDGNGRDSGAAGKWTSARKNGMKLIPASIKRSRGTSAPVGASHGPMTYDTANPIPLLIHPIIVAVALSPSGNHVTLRSETGCITIGPTAAFITWPMWRIAIHIPWCFHSNLSIIESDDDGGDDDEGEEEEEEVGTTTTTTVQNHRERIVGKHRTTFAAITAETPIRTPLLSPAARDTIHMIGIAVATKTIAPQFSRRSTVDSPTSKYSSTLSGVDPNVNQLMHCTAERRLNTPRTHHLSTSTLLIFVLISALSFFPLSSFVSTDDDHFKQHQHQQQEERVTARELSEARERERESR